jgi:hypothetical protein
MIENHWRIGRLSRSDEQEQYHGKSAHGSSSQRVVVGAKIRRGRGIRRIHYHRNAAGVSHSAGQDLNRRDESWLVEQARSKKPNGVPKSDPINAAPDDPNRRILIALDDNAHAHAMWYHRQQLNPSRRSSMNSLFVTALICSTVAVAPVPPQADKPIGATPTMSVAKVDGDRLTLTTTRTVIEFVLETRTVDIGGKTATQTVTIPVQKMISEVKACEMKDVKGFDPANKPIDAAKLAERLKAATPVFISADGQPIDEAFRKLLKNDAILLIVPQGEPGPMKK